MIASSETEAHPPALVCWVAGNDTAERFPTLLRYLQVGLVDEAFAAMALLTGPDPGSLLEAGLCTVLREPSWPWPLGHWARKRWLREFHEEFDDLRRGVPSIVHTLDAERVPLAVDLAEATGSELVVSWNRLDAPPGALLRMSGRPATIACPSNSVAQCLLRAGVEANRVRVVPLGIAAEHKPRAWPEGSAPTIACATSLREEDGVELLLRAARIVVQRSEDALFFIMGRGPEEEALRHAAEAQGIAGNVVFSPRLPHWQSALAEASVLVVPSARAAWREEPLHALAAGVPVVAVEGAPYDELVADQTALLIPPDDEAILAEAILTVIEDPAKAARLGQAAAEHVRSHNGLSRMVGEYLRIYGELAGRQKTLAFPKSA